MRCKPKSNAALGVALGGLPEQMRVEVDADIGVSASTVGQLRRVTASATPRASRRSRKENPPPARSAVR
jgi:hypothetical protein